MYSVVNILLSQILTFNPESHFGLFTDLYRNFLQMPFYFLIKRYEEEIKTNPIAYKKYLLIGLSLFFIYQIYDNLMPPNIFPWKRSGLPWHLEYVPFAIFYMLSGYLYRNRFEKESDKEYLWIVMIIYFVFVFISVFENNLYLILRIVINLFRNYLGIAFVVLLSKNINPSRIILFIGRNTLTYFGIHIKALVLWEKIIYTFFPLLLSDIYNDRIKSAIYSLAVCYVFCFILIIPTKIIDKYFPFMMGRGYKTKQKRYLLL